MIMLHYSWGTSTMQFFRFILHSSMLVLVISLSTKADDYQVRLTKYDSQNVATKTSIIVDQSGHGNFDTIQKAIDSVTSNNNDWTLIHINAGVYNEKVTIPEDKQKILLQGVSRRRTVIQFADSGSSLGSATFSLHAADFVAKDITFKNTYNHDPRNPITWATAALIYADRASFYHCGFVGVVDTLTDFKGRHYYQNCYIEGVVDFIWGYSSSIFQQCIINVTSPVEHKGLMGYIAAQGRESYNNNSGLVFKRCQIYGTVPAYLGRAYRAYSRVLYYRTKMSNIIVPEGWSAWNYTNKEDNILFAEVDCVGPGADKSKRVPWEKNLSGHDLSRLVSIKHFINEEGWLQSQPMSPFLPNVLNS